MSEKMYDTLPNCWEIKKCERQENGSNVDKLGECIVSKEEMGHSCWVVAGTFSGGDPQGTFAQVIGYCTKCEVYEMYSRSRSDIGEEIKLLYPEEARKYGMIIRKLSGIA